MTIASRIVVIITLLVVCLIAWIPPRQALDYDRSYPQADGSFAPMTMPAARAGIFNQDIYTHQYHDGGGRYTDIPAHIDTGRLLAEVILALALGGIVLVITCRRTPLHAS